MTNWVTRDGQWRWSGVEWERLSPDGTRVWREGRWVPIRQEQRPGALAAAILGGVAGLLILIGWVIFWVYALVSGINLDQLAFETGEAAGSNPWAPVAMAVVLVLWAIGTVVLVRRSRR